MAYNYFIEDTMNKDKNFTIRIPKMEARNSHALDALSRKAGKMKDKRDKRSRNPYKQDW
jgi:hypothetical protein